MRFISFLIFTLFIAAPSFADVIGNARVIDGDTLKIGAERIRLHGIDAPELKQTCTVDGKEWACGKAASTTLIDAIYGQKVTCKGNTRDRYKRLIAVCYVGDINLNAMMVREGLALAYRRYSKDFIDYEKTARNTQKGIWRGEFEPPWVWRKRN